MPWDYPTLDTFLNYQCLETQEFFNFCRTSKPKIESRSYS